MIRVKGFKFSKFLNDILKRGGSISGVHYRFTTDMSVRRVESYSNSKGLGAVKEGNGAFINVRRGFHTDPFTVDISEYDMPYQRGSLRKSQKGVLITVTS